MGAALDSKLEAEKKGAVDAIHAFWKACEGSPWPCVPLFPVQQAVIQACWAMVKPFLENRTDSRFEDYLARTRLHLYAGTRLWNMVSQAPLGALAMFDEDAPNLISVVDLRKLPDALAAVARPTVAKLEAIFTFLARHTVDFAILTAIVLIHEVVHAWQCHHADFLGLKDADASQAACISEGHATFLTSRVASLYGMTFENQLGLLFMRFKASTPINLAETPPPVQCYYQAQDASLFRDWIEGGKLPRVVMHSASQLGIAPATGLDAFSIQKLARMLRNPDMDVAQFWSKIMRIAPETSDKFLKNLNMLLRLELQGEVSSLRRLQSAFDEYMDESGALRALVHRRHKYHSLSLREQPVSSSG